MDLAAAELTLEAPVVISTVVLVALLAAGPQPSGPWKIDPRQNVRPATPEDLRSPPPNEETRDYSRPPPGAPADQALWTEVREGTTRSTAQLGRLVQLAFRIRYGKYHDALRAHATGPGAADADRAGDRLDRAMVAAGAAVPERPDVYRCRRVLLDFEQRMGEPPTTEAGGELPAVRAEAQACAVQMRELYGRLTPVADELDATLAAIDRLVGRETPAAPAADVSPGASDRARAALSEAKR